MTQVKIQSLNISTEKGTIKTPVDRIEINETGVKGDAHAGYWHRQVSLLAVESLKKAEDQNKRKFNFGDFGENITTEGIELHRCNILDQFQCGDVLLEVTQIGKKCHTGCEIMQKVGTCIMPIEGIFCRVLKGGELKVGEELNYIPKQVKIAIITLSDRAYRGEYKDLSGPRVKEILLDYFHNDKKDCHIDLEIMPDDAGTLTDLLSKAADRYNLIITTGGTGIGPRDITVETVRPMLSKEIPGVMEYIRVKYGSWKPNALLSRGVAGILGKAIIYTIPGSEKAADEYMKEIIKTLNHTMMMQYGIDTHRHG